MPHIHIDYSANLEPHVDMAQFCQALRAAAVEIDAFPMPGIRVRATKVDHYAIADGAPKHGFIDISVRLREGRAAEVKAAAIQHLFQAAERYLAPVMASRSVALSAEMRDIDAALSPKTGTIRKHLDNLV